MSGRSHPPSGALYHSIPQSDAVPMSSDIGLDGDEGQTIVTASDILVDRRIRWINFMFGSAVLLPWNGAIPLIYAGIQLLNLSRPVLITATPFFLSRLTGSSYKSTFSSYLSSSFTAVSFIVLIYSTATSTQVCVLSNPVFAETFNTFSSPRLPAAYSVQHYVWHS
jgi:solute carrier family 29 (equilibrative nucleoside transporter), member 1/2/3